MDRTLPIHYIWWHPPRSGYSVPAPKLAVIRRPAGPGRRFAGAAKEVW